MNRKGNMRYSEALEQSIVDTIRQKPSPCVTFRPEAYRPDGNILVHRDHLTELLHRRLYRLVIGPLARTDFLLPPSCSTRGCQNPFHRTITHRAAPERDTCPNGHRYNPATDLPGRLRCATCFHLRRERRGLKGTPNAARRNAAKTQCPSGHPYSIENTYLWEDANGDVHRKCKKCTRDRRQDAYRASLSVAH